MSPTLQIVSPSPASCPSGQVVSGGSCVPQSGTDTMLQIFGAPARLLGIQPDGMGINVMVISGAVWLLGAILLMSMGRK